MMRAEEQRKKDDERRDLIKEQDMIKTERQHRKVQTHYHNNFAKNFKKAAEEEVAGIVHNALVQASMKTNYKDRITISEETKEKTNKKQTIKSEQTHKTKNKHKLKQKQS